LDPPQEIANINPENKDYTLKILENNYEVQNRGHNLEGINGFLKF
jgi:hypothetical protein